VLLLAAGSFPWPAAAAGATATAASCGTPVIVNTPTVGTFDDVLGIAAVTGRDAWLVGRYIVGSNDRALVEHWNGTRWLAVQVPQPAAAKVDLYAVTAVSATDAWAVGATSNARDQNQRTLIEHWDGAAWHIVPSPSAGILFGVAAGSANDAWAVGVVPATAAQTARTLTEHWDGTRWQVVPSPTPGTFGDSLAAVSVTGQGSAWAVGTEGTSKFGNGVAFTEHWNGTAWSVVPAPGPGIGSELRAVTSAGANDVWAVGLYEVQTPTGTDDFTLTEHWTGTAWTVVASPSPTGDDDFSGAAAVSANDVWAVGGGAGITLVAHWNGTSWAQVPSPNRGNSVDTLAEVTAPAGGGVWAAGIDISLRDFSYHTLTENLCP
jgi:hypothetical protein